MAVKNGMTARNEVLRALEQSRNKAVAVSGQELAKKLNISRQAVWKAIKSLQKDGYVIHALSNKGYWLDTSCDIISAEGIRLFLSGKNKDCQIIFHKVIDSTNTEAKKLALNGARHGTIVIAEEQTAGRGRMGKTFFSPPGTGIYISFILKPKVSIGNAQLITIYAAVAVCTVIEHFTGFNPKIKWVNDIFLDGRKICGILTEAAGDFESGGVESIIVGIGLNFSTRQEDFPPELQHTAGSLLPFGISRNQFAAALIDKMLEHGDCSFQSSLIQQYKERSFMIGREISYQKNTATVSGTVLDINEKGNLVVKSCKGEIDILRSGEVQINVIHDYIRKASIRNKHYDL